MASCAMPSKDCVHCCYPAAPPPLLEVAAEKRGEWAPEISPKMPFDGFVSRRVRRLAAFVQMTVPVRATVQRV